jgi:sulfate-transporting ATPase
LVPITSLSASNLALIVVPILAAAAIGKFSSFPITTVAGLAMGIAQSEVTRYVSTPGWDTAVPFIFVTLVLYLRGRSVAGRDEAFGKLPSIGSGRLNWKVVVPAGLLTLLCIWVLLPFDWLVALQFQLMFAVILVSFVVVTGYAGQVSLAQMALAGLGALVSAWLYSNWHLPFVLALLGAVVAVVPVGAVIAVAGTRTRGVALAIVTLGLAFSLEAIVFTNPKYTGGPVGFDTDNPTLIGWHIGGLEYPERFATVTLACLVGCGVLVSNLRRGRAGRRLIAVRTNERAAAAMGISVAGAKTYAFVLGAMIAALGGVLLAFYHPTPDFTSFAGFGSVLLAQNSVLGGVGHLGGPLIASSYQPNTVPTQIFSFLGGDVATYLALAGAALLLVLLPTMPDGFAGRARIRRARRGGTVNTRKPVAAGTPDSRSAAALSDLTPSLTLRLEGVTVRFGGTTALQDLSLEVRSGEVIGLIGPNGAGKTTAIDAITGFVKASGGRILLNERDITGWTPERRARAGLSRSFQSLELFDDLSVRENVQAASDPRDRAAYVTNPFCPGRGELTDVATRSVDDFGLQAHLDERVGSLSYARRRLLAVARAVSSGGAVVLLDEPASGLGDADAMTLSHTIRRLARERGVGVLLIEHNVDMVLRTCDRIMALNFGQVIGDGTPAEIRANAAVVEAYLGTAGLGVEGSGDAGSVVPVRAGNQD